MYPKILSYNIYFYAKELIYYTTFTVIKNIYLLYIFTKHLPHKKLGLFIHDLCPFRLSGNMSEKYFPSKYLYFFLSFYMNK